MFTSGVKESLPLASLLGDLARSAREKAEDIDPKFLADMTDEELADGLLGAWDERFPPVVVGEVQPPQEPSRTLRRSREHGDPDDRLQVWRWRAWFPLGQFETLTRWPERLKSQPCGDDNQLLPVSWVYWQQEGPGAAAYFDVPFDEDPDGTTLPRERMVEATAYLHEAANAANVEVAEYRARLRDELIGLLATRRKRLGHIERQGADLIEMVREQFGPIEVEPTNDPDPPVAIADTTGNEIVLSYAVSDGSFEQLVAVTRKWTSGAERYPNAFGLLDEESVTSLLVTTLNVAFDTAHREVYHAKGKTDIFVQANIGLPNEAAHIGEAKIWNGQHRVHTGSDGKPSDVEQLLGYANSRTNQLLLIYYIRQQNRELIEARAIDAVAQCQDFVR